MKNASESIATTDAAAAQEKLRTAISALAKAASKGKLHRNTMSRKIGRLSAQFHKTHVQKSQQA